MGMDARDHGENSLGRNARSHLWFLHGWWPFLQFCCHTCNLLSGSRSTSFFVVLFLFFFLSEKTIYSSWRQCLACFVISYCCFCQCSCVCVFCIAVLAPSYHWLAGLEESCFGFADWNCPVSKQTSNGFEAVHLRLTLNRLTVSLILPSLISGEPMCNLCHKFCPPYQAYTYLSLSAFIFFFSPNLYMLKCEASYSCMKWVRLWRVTFCESSCDVCT